MKLRQIALALLATAMVGIAAVPTASARGFRGGWGRGRGWGWGPGIGLGLGLGLAAGAYPYYGPYYGGGPYYGYGGGCWRRTVVGTPYGPRYRRVWVC
jgi:hypothetical protein